MANNLSELGTAPYQRQLDELMAERSMLEKSWSTKDARMTVVAGELDNLQKVRTFFIRITNLTQQKVKNYLETAANHAISAVFPSRDFQFDVEFGSSRGRTECRLTINEGEIPYDLRGDMGGSILSVLGLSLRVALRGCQKPKRRNVILMDEPFMHVDKNLMEFVGRILKELANQAKIQIIMITHEPTLAQFGDSVHNVECSNRVSTVTSSNIAPAISVPKTRIRRK